MSGLQSHLSGLAAEEAVARAYERRGMTVAERRWRGPAGEIDLILRDGAAVVFVEVKKGRDFAAAAARLTARQIERIVASAAAFLGGEPAGQMTEARIDVALVDERGELHILENAVLA
ncbi:putative endonuclease [Meinhardsimonia xiamenensis]|jgi:putative endonuclease|uniref:UPF0102 protein SAMN05216257_101692 n=1 Tax=Meinhardsimonia xiamenensis TaxID=990712 RepID=A0A1G8ZFQ0_9RHOB|nr:YraN family protein [Meinhardsimonia xiamenensis]PRX37667.1 putative endonuclease [Meinhardsimonia xiamenensis]SDK13245.1 putative endonuclease [Meinhardsimonia xiamenensis]